MKIVLRFGKQDRLKFISHLDLQRTFQFALNRSDLPVAYTQGFTPHAIMSFGSALAMGWTSEYEVFEFRVSEDISAEDAKAALSRALPPDLPVYEVKACDNKRDATMAMVKASDYVIRVENPAVFSAVPAFLAEECFMGVRKTKSGEREINIRPLVYGLEAKDGALCARLALSQTETLKPELLVSALSRMAGCEAGEVRVRRVCLLAEENGTYIPVMEK